MKKFLYRIETESGRQLSGFADARNAAEAFQVALHHLGIDESTIMAAHLTRCFQPQLQGCDQV